MTKPQHPTNDWEFNETTENAFVEWFNDFYGPFSFRSEWFFGDCEIGDEKTRKDILYGWLHAAYVSGYNIGYEKANSDDI
jgi:hypothetical protein